MLNLITKQSLMLNTIKSTISKEKSSRHVSEQCRTLRTSCMRGSEDDRKDRTMRVKDPSELHVTCSRVWSGVRGQGSGIKAACTSYQFLLMVRIRTVMQRENSVQTPQQH